jgi:biopolymer transport protein ExbD
MHVERPDDTVVIIADKEAETGVLTQVMDQVKMGGIAEVSIAAAPLGG